MTAAVSRESVVRRLAAAGCVAASEEASELLEAAPDAPTLEQWVARREAGVPLAWLTGRIHFGGRVLRVSPGVYVPRIQSEELARRAAALVPPGGRMADLCTGCGPIAAVVGAAGPLVVGVDIDPAAAACARDNGVPSVVGDVGAPLRSGVFDVVTAVAPYVPTDEFRFLPSDVQRYEPRVALDGGAGGLRLLRPVIAEAARLLRPGGWLLMEIGGDQDTGLAPVLAAAGFGSVETWTDSDGDLRGLASRLSP